ncbi:uncharacterized protein YjbI with pentapeptide repeats [Nakamurella flavida]|uniref:pentapeptide repeat-containing protein n=1 Tax=Nakamurella flavida TaxID=363630 RepID=UPI0027851FAC|nr:hypothetical protein [Nakamurella flavida]MDP9778472.1 uncharacterized protein YjbI with pentapeptide repeats [Nakamurella flavida]
MVRNDWTTRWEQSLPTQAAVRAWLSGHAPRPDGLGTVGGRIDLRGIELTGAPLTLGSNDDPTAGITWESLDLSCARMDALRLFGARIHDCVFDGAGLVDLRVWGATVTECSFRRADLRHAILGAGEWHGLRSTWTDISFERAKMARAVFTGSVLRRCRFDTPGRFLQMQDCVVDECAFIGVLDTLVVDGRGHRHPLSTSAFVADLGGATFRGTHVTGYRLDRATLPDQADLLVVHRYVEVFTAAADRLELPSGSEADHRAAQLLRRLAAAPGPDLDADICLDLDGLGDAAQADAIRQALRPPPAA